MRRSGSRAKSRDGALSLAFADARDVTAGDGWSFGAAAILRDTGDRHGEGMALNNLGLALREARRFDEANTAHQDAAAVYREPATGTAKATR